MELNAHPIRPIVVSSFSPTYDMSTKSKHTNTNNDPFISLWEKKKKKKKKKQFPVNEFLQENYKKVEEIVSGPGAGIGVGCGVGLGLGLVGGFGYGGWPWNHVKLVFGVGMGCGIGFGFGYGNGIGYGVSMEALESKSSKRTPRNRGISVQM